MTKTKAPMTLLTVEEAADHLKVDSKTVYRLINDKELKAAAIGRVYRIDLRDLEEFLQRSKLKVAKQPRKSY